MHDELLILSFLRHCTCQGHSETNFKELGKPKRKLLVALIQE